MSVCSAFDLNTEFPFHGIVELKGISRRWDINFPGLTFLEAAAAAYGSFLGVPIDAEDLRDAVRLVEYAPASGDKPAHAEFSIKNRITAEDVPGLSKSLPMSQPMCAECVITVNGRTTTVERPVSWAEAIITAAIELEGAPDPLTSDQLEQMEVIEFDSSSGTAYVTILWRAVPMSTAEVQKV